MSSAIPAVFIVDDDVSVRESLELLVRNESWKPKRSRLRRNSSTTQEQ